MRRCSRTRRLGSSDYGIDICNGFTSSCQCVTFLINHPDSGRVSLQSTIGRGRVKIMNQLRQVGGFARTLTES